MYHLHLRLLCRRVLLLQLPQTKMKDLQTHLKTHTPNINTLDLDVGDLRSPSQDCTSYSQIISWMAKSLQLNVEYPPPPKQDLVFDDINQEKTHPLSLAFIPAMTRSTLT